MERNYMSSFTGTSIYFLSCGYVLLKQTYTSSGINLYSVIQYLRPLILIFVLMSKYSIEVLSS